MEIYVDELIKNMEQISLQVIYSITISLKVIDICNIILINISDFPLYPEWIAMFMEGIQMTC